MGYTLTAAEIEHIYKSALIVQGRVHERNTEYLWLWDMLELEGDILDVGCVDSKLAETLAKLGVFKEVWGIDIRPYPNAPFRFIQEDIRRTSLPTEYFDQIVAISTIEHVGMNCYGNSWIDPVHGDRMAILEMYRILADGGDMYITLPYGNSIGDYWIRYYNKNTLNNLLYGLGYDATYYRKIGDKWVECNEEEAAKMPSGEGALPNAIVCVWVVK
ncbi:MAG: class I SAM-dependent methyltransferase [Candidatus Bathyarchaeales archaeon]